MDPYQTLSEYDAIKTFKINDAYEVTIYDTEPSTDKLFDFFTVEDISLYGIEANIYNRVFPFKNCIKFTPPVYEPKEDLLEFCNTTRVVYLPNTEAPRKVELEFSETERVYIWKFIKYCLTKNFLEETMNYQRDHYNPYRYLDRIDISIYDNNLRHKTMTHRFKSCRISSYDYGMDLDYAGSELIKPKIEFSFLQYSIIYGEENQDVMNIDDQELRDILNGAKLESDLETSKYTKMKGNLELDFSKSLIGE